MGDSSSWTSATPFPQAAFLQTAPAWTPFYRVVQEQAASAWVPYRITSPSSKPAPGELFSPWVHWTCQWPVPGQAAMRSQPPLGIHLCVGSFRGCRWISSPPWTAVGCKGTAASPWSSRQTAEESLLCYLEHLLLLLLHWPWYLLSCSLRHLHSSLLCCSCLCAIILFSWTK